MKKFIPYIACGLLLISGWACTRTDDLDVVGVEQGKIVIRTALDPQVGTRAVVADSVAERKITRIDVVVVDPANNTIVHREVHEKADGLNNFSDDYGSGTLSLQKARNTFAANKAYNIYLIANASAAIAAEIENTTATTTLDDLKRLVQEDYSTSTSANGATTFSTLLHLSGTTTPQATAPQTFLMDAVVTASQGSEERNIVLYNGVQTDNTNVYAEFKRAAAKVIINIKQGSSVEFKRTLNLTAADNDGVATMGDAQYEFYNLPTETKVLAEGYDLGRDNNTLIETNLITIPNSGSYPTFVWKDDVGSVGDDVKVQIIGYADAHEWANASTLNYEPSLLLNLPIMWDANKDADKPNGDGKETARGGNWYKVPLSQNKVFERNTCYIVNITINAIGAESKSEAIELDDIDYDTRPWDVTEIKIGNNSERPKYLKLNTDLVTMYNTNIDTEQLVFSSSSPITSIVLKDVYNHSTDDNTFVAEDGDNYSNYYVNKYGIKTSLSRDISQTITANADGGILSGNITIVSPIVPESEAEIQQTILQTYGPAPEMPTLTIPSYSGTIKVEPEFVPEPSAPNWQDYLDDLQEVRSPSASSSQGWSGSNTSQTRSVTVTRYRYNEELEQFEYSTATTTDTRTRNSRFQSWNYSYGTVDDDDFVEWNIYNYQDWEDALTQYNTDMALRTQYESDLREYEEWEKSVQSDPDYIKYLEDLKAYNDAMAAYGTEKDEYDSKVAALRVQLGGEESHYNTIRYLEFEVMNEEGLTAIFRVMQYPVINITNQQGWYSYREDFNCTYEREGDGYVSVALGNGGTSYNFQWDGTYNYTNDNGSTSSYFWHSKYVSNYNQNTGKSTTSFYDWVNGSVTNDSQCESSTNARMYRVEVMSSSPNYTVGIPAKDANGYTDGGEDNAKLVSPSFMIASRLGAIYATAGGLGNISNTTDDNDNGISDRLEIFREHCKQYVEVYKDADGNAVVLDDWRLPTEEEIKIIISLQGGANEDAPAIDYLLNGYYYMSASGPVYNNKGNQGTLDGSAIRCIRDAYNDPKEN